MSLDLNRHVLVCVIAKGLSCLDFSIYMDPEERNKALLLCGPNLSCLATSYYLKDLKLPIVNNTHALI